MQPFLLVALGGGLGSVCRYAVGRWAETQLWARPFPLGTLIVNVVGAFILGLLAVLLLDRASPPRRELYLLLGTGFCGGFTTFSTFKYEALKLLIEGQVALVFSYLMVSVFAGFVAVWCGVYLGQWLSR